MWLISQLVSSVIIKSVLCTQIPSQTSVIHATQNIEGVSFLEQRETKEEPRVSQEERTESIHETVNVNNHIDGYYVKERIQSGHAYNGAESTDSTKQHGPTDEVDKIDNRKGNTMAAQVVQDAMATVVDTVDAEEGLMHKLMNGIMNMLQADFNFLISCGTIMSSILMQIIPLHTIMTIRWNRSTGDLKTINFVTVAFANFLWSLYGMLSGNTVIILSSLPGFVLSCCYLCVFHRNCLDDHQMHILRNFYKLAVVSSLILMLVYLGMDTESYLKFIGLFGGSIQAFSYVTPLLSIKEIIKSRSTTAMPMEISLANFVGAFFTLCYGFIIWDYIVIAPNFVGMVSGMIQIILLVLISNSDKIIVKEVDILEKQHIRAVLKPDLDI